MNIETISFLLIALVAGLIIGSLVASFLARSRLSVALQSAREQGSASAAVEIATLTERARANDIDREQYEKERYALTQSLSQLREDHAVISERASRVPVLEEQITRCIQQADRDAKTILQLSTESAEKNQAISDANARLQELEKDAARTEQRLAEITSAAIVSREEAARSGAQLKAERDTLSDLRVAHAQEKEARMASEESLTRLALELAEANKQRAVFESLSKAIQPLELKLRETEELLGTVQAQVADLRETSGQLHAELNAEREALSAMKLNLQAEKTQREAAETKGNSLSMELAEVSGRLESQRRQADEKLSLLIEAKEALTNQFKSLANDILDEKSKKFTEQNQTNIGQLLDPLRTKIHEFQGKVEEVYIQEGKDRSALAEQVRQLAQLNQTLSQDARNLATALKGSSKTQGNWGELILERVLEACCLRKGHEYDVQESHTREDGTRAQPDVVIHLPEERHLIVDAKVSLVAYEAWVSADDEAQRQVAAKRHVDSMRNHMKGLSDKNYQTLYGLKSLDFVLMFVPIEPAFMLAITHDQGLCMDAYNKNVLLVSPSTLLFVVRTVAHLWRQEAQSKNAQDIAKRGGELYDRLVAFVVDLEKVGDRLRQTQESYTEARNKLCRNSGNVIRQAEMLKKLGAKASKSFPDKVRTIAAESEIEDEGGPDIPPVEAIEFVQTAA